METANTGHYPTRKPYPEASNTTITAENIIAHYQTGRRDFRGANLRGANLSGADLSGADLSGANLSRANLSRANLRGANLSDADLSGADLSGANLSGANLRVANLRDANLSGADLSGANLRVADLSVANLRVANLRVADLSVADLSRANLRGANLRDADLSGADLRGADLSGAKGLFDAPAWFDEHFETDPLGYIVYKIFGLHRAAPDSWHIESGATLTENVNPCPVNDCACGINVATWEWVRREAGYPATIWKCRIRWPWLVGVVVPYGTDGKIRCSKLELLEIVQEKEEEEAAHGTR